MPGAFAPVHGAFGEPFQLIDSSLEVHTTPWGAPQQFVYCFCRRQARQARGAALSADPPQLALQVSYLQGHFFGGDLFGLMSSTPP